MIKQRKEKVRPLSSSLLYKCEEIKAIHGVKALKRYLKMIESRPILGINQETVKKAIETRKQIWDYLVN